MILSDQRILDEMENGTIKIEPYDRNCLGSNSYDVHLGQHLALYVDAELDAKKHNTIAHFDIPEEGYVLMPDQFYLGVTLEYTETHAHVPFLEGKSSTGRLGIDIHATAGKGDVGFREGVCRDADRTVDLLPCRRRDSCALQRQEKRKILRPAQPPGRKYDVEEPILMSYLCGKDE